MYKQLLALNNLQGLIYYKTKQKPKLKHFYQLLALNTL